MSAELARTRRALHAIAEQLMAGPQYRASGTIRLRVRDDGFGTVADPDVRVDGKELVVNGQRVIISGATIAAIAGQTGLDPGPPEGVYPVRSEAFDGKLRIDVVIAAKFAEAFSVGDAALRALAPHEEPVLWPEHFDVAIRLDDINYGVSPGDDYLSEPYAYVGVDPVPSAPFWNAPFGAARPLAELPGTDAVVAFFEEGAARRT
jgi:hypothetical protein